MFYIDDDFKKTRMYQSMMQDAKEDAKQQVKEEVKQQVKQQTKLEAVPRLLALGLSLEQVASALDLTVEQVQQAGQNQSS